MNFSYDIKKLENELNPIYIKLINEVSRASKVDKHHSGKVEITEILKPFTHIMLDEKYKIVAYCSYEIHGSFGEAVAIEKDKEAPDVHLEHEYSLFQRIIPNNCYPVNEVIFCDGTPEGFLEVILLNNVIWKLFNGYAKVYLSDYIFSANDIKTNKEFLFEPNELLPKYYKNHNGISKLLLLKKSYDYTVKLCEYLFSNENVELWQKDKEYSHIEFEKGRFTDGKCCCYFSCKSIDICEGEESDFLIKE